MPANAFQGFDDWIEIFRAGTHTDSAGNTRTWTAADLDEIVANHRADDPAPAVVGHPRTDDPAWGWTAALKREGTRLYARFRDVAAEFEQAVREGRYRNRSVRIGKTADGFRLIHVGWLGAAAPAVSGMAPVYSAPAAEATFEYVEADWYTPSLLHRVLRRLRDWMIAEKGLDTADDLIPDYLVDDARRHADELLERSQASDPEPEPAFAAPDNSTGGDPVPQSTKTFTQAELDQAVTAAVEQATKPLSDRERQLKADLDRERRERRRGEFQARVDAAIDAGKLTPAQAAGMVEFALSLADGDAAAFEFTLGEGDKAATHKRSPLAWFSAFIDALPERGRHLFREQPTGDDAGAPAADFAAPAGYTVDPGQLEMHNRALAYQAAHPGVEYLAAVQIVERSH